MNAIHFHKVGTRVPSRPAVVARDLRARGSETNRTRPWGWPINRLVAGAGPAPVGANAPISEMRRFPSPPRRASARHPGATP